MERMSRDYSGNHFIDGLSEGGFNLLKPFLTKVDLPRSAVICQMGGELDHVWFPITTILSVVTVMVDGQDIEACTIGHDSAYGLLNALGSPVCMDRVIAQVPGTALRAPAARCRSAAASNAAMVETIVRHAQVNTAQIQQSVACNALHDIDARLCRWLLMTADRTRSHCLPLTQEFLSFMLGVQRTTVTSAAQALQAAGSIRYSRGMIEILDRDSLLEGACECYRIVLEKHSELLGARPFAKDDPFESPSHSSRLRRFGSLAQS